MRLKRLREMYLPIYSINRNLEFTEVPQLDQRMAPHADSEPLEPPLAKGLMHQVTVVVNVLLDETR